MSGTFYTTPFFRNVTDNTVWQITPGICGLERIVWHNDDALLMYLQMFNAASADITLGTTTPDFTMQLPPNSTGSLEFGGMKFNTALSLAVTTTATGSTGGTSSWLAVGIY